MKKLFFIFAIAILLSSGIAHAGLLPLMVYGTVTFDNVAYYGQTVTLRDVRLDYSWTAQTNDGGVYQFTFNDLQTPSGTPAEGDTIEVTVCPVDLNPNCKQTFVLSENPTQLNFALPTAQGLINPSNCPACQCGGGGGSSTQIVYVNSTCPLPSTVCPDPICPTPTTLACPVQQSCPTCPEQQACPAQQCPTCETCQQCPVQQGGLLGILMGLVGGAVASGGIVYLTFGNRKLKIVKVSGVDKVYHSHPGISGYHDPNTQHTDIDERHAKGELLPVYVKNASGK